MENVYKGYIHGHGCYVLSRCLLQLLSSCFNTNDISFTHIVSFLFGLRKQDDINILEREHDLSNHHKGQTVESCSKRNAIRRYTDKSALIITRGSGVNMSVGIGVNTSKDQFISLVCVLKVYATITNVFILLK